jgi:integrase
MWVLTKLLTKTIPHTFIRNGYYYFSRRVPSDLRDHYSYHRIVQGLRTTSAQKAKVQASITAAKLEAYWNQVRLAKSDVIGMSLVRDTSISSLKVDPKQPQSECPSLLDALEVYLEQKGKGRPKTFRVAAERSCNYLIGLCGNKPLSDYTRQDALQFRDWLIARGLTGSSITRNFSYLKAVINFALSEYALDVRNPFIGVYHDRSAGVLVRKPIPMEAIRNVQSECRAIDDDMRWLIALISDTGMRLAEVAGLLKQDFIGLDTDIPHVCIIKHPWRNLKTASSEREIPLVGEALWAARRIIEADTASNFAFPRYNRGSATAANSASAALNKWLKQYVPVGCTMHSFRHSMRDRLRAVQCPPDIADEIGGWTTDGVGQGYGSGYPMSVTREWLEKAK